MSFNKTIFILEYRKSHDFRYSALGFGEFCKIHPRQARDSEAQGVTVKQQASGLLFNARGVKPLWKISALALILLLLSIGLLKTGYGNTAGILIIQMTVPIRQGRRNQTNGDYMI